MLRPWCKCFLLILKLTHVVWTHSLEDLIERNNTNKLVSDLVDLDRVGSLLRTISKRRQFLAILKKKRAEKYEKGMLFSCSLNLLCP